MSADPDPEPVIDDDGEETGAYHCPDCGDVCWNEAKALACCADESDSPETPNERVEEPGSGDANPGEKADKPTSLPATAFDPITDPEFDGSAEAVREHYRRAGPLLDAIESVGAFPTSAFAGNSGWYRYTDVGGLDREAFDDGYRSFRRAYTIERDREELLDAIERDPDEDSWRSLYAITSYKDPEAVYSGAYSKERRGGFDGGEGLPDYADIRALPFWIDVDLADDRDDALDPEDETEYGANLKDRRGDLDPRERRLIERALDLIITEVADVYDLPPEAIAAFDSGGGSYPYGPAAATIPVAERYDEERRERLFDELTDRMNAYAAGDEDTPGTIDAYGFEGIIPRVEERVPGAKYLLDADALLNKNRQTKAPGSIHKTHDIVVTPLRDESGTVDYTPTLPSEFATDDALRERTVAEARKFTEDTPEARACVDPLVETLFPEYAARDDLDGWAGILDAWLSDDWERRRARIHASARDDKRRRARREERREELAGDLDREPTEEEVSAALADQTVTTVRQDVFDDLDRIDVGEVIRTYAADEWDTSNRGHETTFDPSWRPSGSSMSCAVPNGGDTFIDNKASAGGGPAKAYALGTGIIPRGPKAAATPLRRQKWGEAVDGLRGEGYDIRVYVPEAGEEYDETPLWGLRNAAVALDVCGPGEFKEHETDNGETYLGFDHETFNGVLDALDEAGIDHGRERLDPDESDGRQYAPEVCTPPAFDPEEFDREQRWQELQGERYEKFLDTTGPHVWGDPAGVGKSTNAELGGAGRDRPYFAAFDKHEKAREAIADDVTPDEKFHLKGGEQPVEPCCMDAATAADEGETPHCSEHGHPADWPRMCPIYDRGTDDDLRRRYEALVGALGPRGAHIALGLFDEDKHPWHGGQCRWAEQFDHLLDEDGNPHPDAERIAGVHEYQLLKSAPKGRDVIVDESPRPLASEQRVGVEQLAHARVRFDGLADVHESDPDDDLGGTLRALAEFTDNLMSALADDDPTTLADLDAPDVRPGVWRDYQGINSEHYTEREDYAEPLAKAKLAYNEGLVRQYRDEDADLPTAPFCVDALLAAAAKAGVESGDVRRAIAVPTTLETCPWCGSSLDDENGARVCSDDDCGWDERENSITQRDGEQARASAWADDDPDDLRGEFRPALIYGELPETDDLPDDPLILDATATPEKIAGLYGADLGDVEVTGDAALDLGEKFHLMQVVGGQYGEGDRYHAGGQYHAQTIKDTESIQHRIQTAIDRICDRHDHPLFGIRGDLIPLFEFPENAEVLKYHAARGLNRSDCDAVCCIGAPHPDVEDIRRKAELLALDNPDLRVGGDEYSTRRNAPNPPVYRKLRYEDESGDGLAVPTKAYSGLVGELFRESREKELEQFVHRIRPHLVDPDEEPMKHGYLLTDVPTDLAVDEVAGFEELVDPLYKQADLPEGAMAMQEAALDALDRRENGQPIAGVRPQRLVETDGEEISMRAEGWQELCRVYGIETRNGSTPSLSTVYDWLERLDALDLLRPGEYEQREGRRHSGSTATLNLALQYLNSNANFKVDVVRRFRRFVADGASAETWLSLLAGAFDAGDGVSGGHPPPDPT